MRERLGLRSPHRFAATCAAALAGALPLPGARCEAVVQGDDARSGKAWTILVYGAADNNADDHFQAFLNDVRRAIADDPAFELVVFVDRHAGYSNESATFGEDFTGGRLYRMEARRAQRLDGGEQFPECAADFEPDTADPELLQKFLAYGLAHHPARRTALIIYSHANGISMCPDEQSRRDMGIPEMAQVVGAEHAVDWVALELCNMSGIEIAYEWSAFSDGFSTGVLTAIPNAGPPLDWKRIFERVHSPGHPAAAGRADVVDPWTLDARGFGRLAVEEGEKGRLAAAEAGGERAARARHEAAASLDLEHAGAVKEAVDAFAVALAQEPDPARARQAMERLRDGGEGTPPVLNYVGDDFRGPGGFVDLYALLERAAACAELTDATRAAARAAMEATDSLVLASFGMPGFAGFVPGKHGVFLHFPAARSFGGLAFGRPAGPGRAWYSALPCEQERSHLGEWAWCRDGATRDDRNVQNWFELLDAWFDDAEDGGENGWRY